jgi:hypothetical protein
VHPNWILDSIAQNKQLPVASYILYKDSPSLTNFLKPVVNKKPVKDANNSSSEEELPPFANSHGSDDDGRRPKILFNLFLDDFLPPVKKPTIQRTVTENKARTANDENFMAAYFESSRLHHLSMWRTEFQKELNEFIASSQGIQLETCKTPICREW